MKERFKKIDEFNRIHEQAVENIYSYLEEIPDSPQMNGLVRWMLEADVNPYSYLEKEYAGLPEDAVGFAQLLDTIYHAVYDDGDILFIKVEGVPKIVFCDFDALSEFGDNVEILDILPNEFGAICDKYHLKQIKAAFAVDCAIYGEVYACSYYSEYKAFEASWVEEMKDTIARIKSRRGGK